MNLWREFHGSNAGFVLELYERYLQDPATVDTATREFFEHWTPPLDGAAPLPSAPATGEAAALPTAQIVGTVRLAQAIREFGHLAAQIDPLGSPPPGDPALDLEALNITEADLRQLPASLIGGPVIEGTTNALEAIYALRAIYSSSIGYDYDHIHDPTEREWLREAAEARRFRSPNRIDDPVVLLKRLTEVEVFERFLHRIFPGKTRFSIEGLDLMVPMLDEIVCDAAGAGIYNVLIGMAHRGRLNVLAHVLGKPYDQILAEFKDPIRPYHRGGDIGWAGDVKYHSGAKREAINLVVTLAPNPSHLEAVNPVVGGMARAAGTNVAQPGPAVFNPSVTLPVLIHGDMAFPGQGVVAETMTFSRIPGFRSGGTIHIIANNQLGYTALGESGRSTLYASDLAKGFEIPVVHVNADDPEACLEAARLALAYRVRFQKDFLIDLVGYRRYGHNEGDEPGFTQPLMYQHIDKHPTVRELWARHLKARGLIAEGVGEDMVRQHMEELQRIFENLQPEESLNEPQLEAPPPGAARRVKTAVPIERLHSLNEALLQLPEGFTPHPKLERARQRRYKALDELDQTTIDWAMAEELAFATILEDGVSIRLTGEDVERGTFSHRHAVLHDYQRGKQHLPLQKLPQAKAAFEARSSPLSEFAAVGFEYGYSIQMPQRLVLWEAQYGDFINGAQIIVDQFIVSARAKWGQSPSLVLLLPHGYEGQGPEHSSARLERFLNSAADKNMRVANCTTAAQYFHLLRRQAALLTIDPLPLIVMTPKSLLRHPLTASTPRDLAEGIWQQIIADPRARQKPEAVKRLIVCSGKVYVDLVSSEQREKSPAIAISRLEQLYPVYPDMLKELFDSYPKLREVVWVQEEPENMGAWEFIRPYFEEALEGRCPLRYIARPRASSPSEGSSARHAMNQKAIVAKAFEK